MREEDIRPVGLQSELHALLKLDAELWLADKENFIRVNCPACDCSQTKYPVEVRSYTFETCTECDTVFYNPRPTLEQLHAYYSRAQSYTYWATKIFPQTEEARRENIFKPMADRVIDFVSSSLDSAGTLVEIGAGFGIFCEEISRRKIFDRVIAVEPTPDLARKCQQRNLETIAKPYEQIELEENSVSCIAAFEVIEHLFEPRFFLNKCRSLLEPGGLLILTCPNIKGFDFTVLGKQVAPNFGLGHINMFHPESISRLVEAQGFSMVDILTPGKLDADIVRNQVQQGKFDLTDQPFLKRVLIDEWDELGGRFQKFLSDNLLSSNMLIVARKTS